jgi:DNA-binding transcriptional LysR family regulator
VAVTELPTREQLERELASGELDLALGHLSRLSSSLRRRRLFETRIVSVASKAHPRIRGRLGLEDYLREGHVAIDGSGPIGLIASPDGLLKREGLRRRVVARVANPEVALLVVSESDLICSATELMVEGLAHLAELQVLDHPLTMPRLTVSAAWHARSHAHPMHDWFRKLVFGLVELRSGSQGRRTATLGSVARH